MTPITRLAAPVMMLATLVAAALPLAGAAPPSRHPIDPLRQHVVVHTRDATGQPLDPMFYGRWSNPRTPSPTLMLNGASNRSDTTVFSADTPAPGLSRRGLRSYCLTQDYTVVTGDTLTAHADWASTVVVRRHGRVAYRHRVAGSYLSSTPSGGMTSGYTYGPIKRHTRVGFGQFRVHRHDHVTWIYSGALANQVDRFRSVQTVTASC